MATRTVPREFFLPSSEFTPAHLRLGVAELRRRAEEALDLLQDCVACPRDCHVNRWDDRIGVCRTGRYAIVSSFFPHFGEEDCLRGWNGSGTIFFSMCNLRCAFCLAPSTPILTAAGAVPVADLFAAASGGLAGGDGDAIRIPSGLRVWTHTGVLAFASKIFRHRYDGDLVVIKPTGLPPLRVTPNHDLFVVRRDEPAPRRVPAGRVAVGDRLLVPRIAGVPSPVVLEARPILESQVGARCRPARRRVPAHPVAAAARLRAGELASAGAAAGFAYHPADRRALLARPGGETLSDEETRAVRVIGEGARVRLATDQSPGIPARIPLDCSAARLLGLFCARGRVRASPLGPGPQAVVLSFDRRRTHVAEDACALFRQVLGLEPSVRVRARSVTVEAASASAAVLFDALCGSGPRRRRVPAPLYVAPPDVVGAFVHAYREGGGRRAGSSVVASTVCEEMASGLALLLLRLGMFPYLSATRRLSARRPPGRTAGQSRVVYRVMCRPQAARTHPRAVWALPAGEGFAVPIRWIRRVRYRGPVFNLEVDDPAHSYIASGVAVANCQNYDISQLGRGRVVTPHQLAAMMLHLQDVGCHNINFVTPEHVVPQILEALPLAVEGGLRLPIVYNTSSYDSMHSLRLLDGIVDIYMPDFKFWDPEMSRLYMKAPDYPEVARRVIAEMHRQVGELKLDEFGLARRGVLIRHLVMPGGIAGTREIMAWIARQLSVHSYVNIMDQYYPAGLVGTNPRYDAINRRITSQEFAAAVAAAREAGLYRLDVRLRRHPLLRWSPEPAASPPARVRVQ